jgi:glycosyltransferase involved in cell wall biosynthesis
MKRIAIVTTHPIQYYAPFFRLLNKEALVLKVFYTWGDGSIKKFDPDFQKVIQWDIPLLEGYQYQFLTNTSKNPGTHHFRGIITPEAIKEIEAFSPNAILIYGWSWQSHLTLIRYFSGKIPLWFRGDSTLLDQPPGVRKTIRRLYLRWVYRHVDLAFYVGQENKRYFKAFGLTEQQLRFAPHSIDNRRFAADRSAEAAQLREGLGIPPDGILILFAGKLEAKKDPEILLAAFESVPHDNVYLLFAGNGVLEARLQEKARECAKGRSIFFLPFQNQSAMPALYQACQLFCLPSAGPGETWGLAVNEAMAAGRAVLVSDKAGCAPDLVKEGVNGSVFRNRDLGDLTQKLGQLTADKGLLEAYGRASGRLIEKWGFDAQVSLILDELNTA